MYFYSYDEFEKDVKILAKDIKKNFNTQSLVAIARGGMSLAHSLAVALENRNLFSLNSIHYNDTQKLDTIEVFNIPNLSKFESVLLVDDIIDSGESMLEIKKQVLKKYPHLQVKVATIFYKENALLIPEFKTKLAKEWVEFYWDIKI